MSLTPDLPGDQIAAESPTVTPAGWYPDYTGEPQLRWWDGAQWTQHVQGGTEAPYSLTAKPATVPAGTPVFTPYIWILTLLPVISLIVSGLTFNEIASHASNPDPVAMMQSPAYTIASIFGLALYAATIVLAYLDRRTLLARGFERPFHWAFAFIPVQGVVYSIGRSVVVRRRAGRGISPMWVSLALIAVSLIVSIGQTAAMMSTMLNNMPGVGTNT